MVDDFILRATIAGLAVALATGVLGCFVIWRKMAYFGDALSHASILGVAGGLALGMSSFSGVLVIALVMSLLLYLLNRQWYATDTILGVLSHSALAFGLIATNLMSGYRISLDALLFGDILAVSWRDLWVIWGGAVLVVGVIALRWSRLISVTVGQDLAASVGINARKEQLFLTLTLALTIAISVKVVGALLVTAFLIIPAATARRLAQTPEQMATISVGVGTIAVLTGMSVSYEFDTLAGPTMVASAAVLFAIVQLIPRRGSH